MATNSKTNSCLGNPVDREEPWQASVHGDHKRVGRGLATQQQMIVLAVVFVASSVGQSRGTGGQDFLWSSLYRKEGQGLGATWTVRDSG